MISVRKQILLAFIFMATYTSFGVSWAGTNYFMSQLMGQMDVKSLTLAGMISSAVTAGQVLAALLAPYIGRKLGVIKSFTGAFLFLSLAFLTPFIHSFPLFLTLRVVVGFGGILSYIFLNSLIKTLLKKKTILFVKAVMGIHLSSAIVLWATPSFFSILGIWQNILILYSIIPVILFAVWLIILRQKWFFEVKSDRGESLLRGMKRAFNWQFALANVGIMAPFFIMMTYYKKLGLESVNTVILATCFGGLTGFFLMQIFPKISATFFVRVFAFVQLIFFILLHMAIYRHWTALTSLYAIIFGFTSSIPISIFRALPFYRKGISTEALTTTFSIALLLSDTVAIGSNFIFGFLLDHTKTLLLPFIFMSFLAALFFIVSLFFKREHFNFK